MAPSKNWMLVNNRLSEEYKNGVSEFLNYAFQRNRGSQIRCPCIKCCNGRSGTRETISTHLIIYGIVSNYTFWCHHGEKLGEAFGPADEEVTNSVENDAADSSENEIHQVLWDLYPSIDLGEEEIAMDFEEECSERPNDEADKFYRLLNDFEQPIYEGCKSSKLSTIVKLLHIKSLGRWSNESFNMLLKLLKEDLLPEGSSLPDSYYESKKTIQDLGLSYTKIDVCEHSCMLFWKDDAQLDYCKVCHASRWKVDKHSGEVMTKANGKKLPKKTLRYFPLKPRLQRLYLSTKIASLMTWHHENKAGGEVMRHPSDSLAWKSFDGLHQSFSADPRNVRLALASDGFQPFAHSKTPYSIWPVVLIPYNLPPSMIMKPSNFILSMLIPGPESPGDAIDVYLQPLIEDLKDLWEEGVQNHSMWKSWIESKLEFQ